MDNAQGKQFYESAGSAGHTGMPVYSYFTYGHPVSQTPQTYYYQQPFLQYAYPVPPQYCQPAPAQPHFELQVVKEEVEEREEPVEVEEEPVEVVEEEPVVVLEEPAKKLPKKSSEKVVENQPTKKAVEEKSNQKKPGGDQGPGTQEGWITVKKTKRPSYAEVSKKNQDMNVCEKKKLMEKASQWMTKHAQYLAEMSGHFDERVAILDELSNCNTMTERDKVFVKRKLNMLFRCFFGRDY
ncbi:uncharacterized protein LOC129800073 [Phlebotomus papatasi]|uniref:uncharacterized protein LOC129800073 n=1 Tax=Phlebotomus papatasi TaxID=29031 RepID=UPI002483C2BB|nr:uncharacterized protein LOC129800073 [Phlebotomus papatasi]